jgi:hypothetical protein
MKSRSSGAEHVRSTKKGIRSGRAPGSEPAPIDAAGRSFPGNNAQEGFDRVADRCVALIDARRNRGTAAAFPCAIVAILDNAAPIAETPSWELDDAELDHLGYVALSALREAGLA